MNTTKTTSPVSKTQPAAQQEKRATPVLDSEEYVYSSQEVGGLSIFLGDGTYLNGKPFKYHA